MPSDRSGAIEHQMVEHTEEPENSGRFYNLAQMRKASNYTSVSMPRFETWFSSTPYLSTENDGCSFFPRERSSSFYPRTLSAAILCVLSRILGPSTESPWLLFSVARMCSNSPREEARSHNFELTNFPTLATSKSSKSSFPKLGRCDEALSLQKPTEDSESRSYRVDAVRAASEHHIERSVWWSNARDL